MVSHKNPRDRGKFSFSRYFQSFKQGEKVAVVKELGVPFAYSHRLQGRTGTIIAKRGASYYLDVPDLGKSKKYLIKPIHLKRLQTIK